ncbi:bifunctional riboflavin kinase/FAD synthetase [Alkalibaculum sp. M08DMB]|uniref:Riboflavin biosynthesis protein n=1 Tax=Alkalibaculum sporogenes TaxID=2655001 RepID=A0A6A7K8J2_9FIRM|nr:bifunctional riboflavin kinase/FAD synthetase [Alkalibaculum sporogenes]MPW25829.1 bifunctional riboflavin kinase/FAD synthetase [Alkalibaculum sporogenes]
MECVYLNKDIKFTNNTAIALGFFDGIHLGHRNLINTMKKKAKELELDSCVVTFDKHPLSLAFNKYAPKLISSNEDKIKLFNTLDINKLVFLNFDEEMMNTNPEIFTKQILVDQLKVKSVIVGFNYNFGHKGIGTPDLLTQLGKDYNFDVTIVNPYEVDQEVVSSSLIRNLITSGKVDAVEKYLGRKYSITGKVIRGKGLGRTYNIPTANIGVGSEHITPEPGVYLTSVIYKNKVYDGLTNVGYNPTFKNHAFSIETYIYDFSKDIYGEELEIIFVERIRKEKKFANVNELIHQIEDDIALIREKYL